MEKYNFSYIKFSSTFRYGISQRFFSRVDASKLVVIIRFFFCNFQVIDRKANIRNSVVEIEVCFKLWNNNYQEKKNRIRLTHKYGD